MTTESDTDKVESFIKGVESLAKLLRGLSIEAVAEATKEEACEMSVSMFEQRRKAWAELYIQMSDDMQSLMKKMDDSKIDMNQCLAKTKAAVAVFNGSEFKEASDNLERFVSLCDRLQAFKGNGFLDTVIETISKA